MNHARSSGFTLIEILMAMAIFTLIGLASTSLLTTVIDSDELSTERFDQLQKLQRAMLVIERDLLQAVPRRTRINGESVEQVMRGGRDLFDSEADGIGLVRAGWHNPQMMLPRSTLQAVAYRLQDGNLERLYGNYVDNVIGYEPKIKVLLENINDFQVEFKTEATGDDDDDRGWKESFQGTQLPVAIAIEIDSIEFGLIRREFVLANGGQS